MTDVARIHLAAAFDITISGQWLIAAADPFNCNEMINAVKKLKPSAKVPQHLAEPGKDLVSKIMRPVQRCSGNGGDRKVILLLRRLSGRTWRGFVEYCV